MKSLLGNTSRSVPFFFVALLTPLAGQSVDRAINRAQQEQAVGQYAMAAADYATASRLDPGVPELWANRGLMEYLAGKPKEAIASLQHALKLNPALVSPLLFLGKAYIDTGQHREAISPLERALQLRPEDPQVLIALGKANEGIGNWAAAATAHRAAVDSDPKLTAAWFSLGVDALSLIDEEGRTLSLVAPKSVWSSALYADELLKQGRAAEAVTHYQELATVASASEAACLLRTLEQDGSDPAAGANNFPGTAIATALREKAGAAQPSCGSEQAPGAYWYGDYSTSAAAAGRRLHTARNSPDALYWSIKSNEKVAVEALAHFQQLAPQSAASADLLGDLYRRRRQPGPAIEAYQRALAVDPNDAVAWLGTSAAFLSTGQTQKSIEAARAGLERQPDHPQLNLLLAEGLVADHRYDEAKPCLARSRPLPAELTSRMHALAGTIAAHDGDTTTAIRELSQALPTDEDGSLHYQLYRLYKRVGRERDAERTMAEVKAIEAQRREHAVVAVQGANGQPSE